jgi:hypothetical protein
MDRPFYTYMLTTHSTSRGIAALSTRPARNSTPSSADSMPYSSTGLIHYCRQLRCTPSLAAERASSLHTNELSSTASHNLALVMLATQATNARLTADQPANLPALGLFASQQLSFQLRRTTYHSIIAETVLLYLRFNKYLYKLVPWLSLLQHPTVPL